MAYRATARAMRCPVLTRHMVLPDESGTAILVSVPPHAPGMLLRYRSTPSPVLTWRRVLSICLHPWYAMSGTDAAHNCTRVRENERKYRGSRNSW
eukprot:3618078-Rhodomonas_salina.6